MTASPPRLVVGLGNPGSEYQETRHNAGFWFCTRLADELGVHFQHHARFHGLLAHAPSHSLWLLLPQTFMNHSGQSVGALARFYRIRADEILVVHDELDIPPGQLRLKFGGGLGGHNGLKSITAHAGTQDFWRLRIGIGHPGDRNEVIHFVLKPPRREERELIDTAIDRALQAWPYIAHARWNTAIKQLHTRTAQTPSKKDHPSS